MARRKRKRVNQQVRERRLFNVHIDNIVRSEPVIRVFDRRDSYQKRKLRLQQIANDRIRRERNQFASAPRRGLRKAIRSTQKAIFGSKVYENLHNCKQEWRKLLSWRSAQGGGRKRTVRELRNNKSSFNRKDC